MSKENTNKGFTLMELMVVLIVMGVVAGLAMPKYAQSVESAHRKDAENQLMLIHSAQDMYASRNNNIYWGPAAGATPASKLANINLNLALNILSNGMDYDCTAGIIGDNYTCTATRIGGAAFTITVTEAVINPGVNPSCAPVASCP
jgi:prepilin-type N-terminal cleavage/methylation domain-containing protein